MKVVFVESKSNLGIYNLGARTQFPMIGTLYLGTILENAGHEVEIYNENIGKLPKHIDADILALNTLTATAPRAYMTAKKFKEDNPDKRVIIGGIHASNMPQEASNFADQVVVGEAEGMILDLIENRINKKITVGDKLADLDSLPFPNLKLVKGLKKIEYLPISTSRGCPFNCRFCSVTGMFGRQFRYRSPPSVIDEILNQESKKMFFYDDNFTANQPRVVEILKLMKKHNIKRPWGAQTRIDVAKNPELLKLMSETECDFLFLGLESVNPETLKSFNKQQNVAEIRKTVKTIQDYGIKVWGSFVLGSDEDDKFTFRKTLDFCSDINIDWPQFSILTPFPGSQTHIDLREQKRIFTTNWALYDALHTVFLPKKMSPYELQNGTIEALKEWYWDKRKIALKLLSNKSVFNIVKTIKSVKYLNNFYTEKKKYLEILEKISEKKKNIIQKFPILRPTFG